MISDMLSEAVEEIERYQKDMPDCYEGLRFEIDTVKEVMDCLRLYLDRADPDAQLQNYKLAMRSIDLTALRTWKHSVYFRAAAANNMSVEDWLKHCGATE